LYWVGGSVLGSLGQYAFQWFPWQMGHGPRGGFLGVHSLLKWPSCPHWKHIHEFGLLPRGISWSTVFRASCFLFFLYYFLRSFFFFSEFPIIVYGCSYMDLLVQISAPFSCQLLKISMDIWGWLYQRFNF
jgi:hypothetical protein